MNQFIPAVLMSLSLMAPPSDVFVLPDPNLEIPINVNESKRTELRELYLYMSNNQGRTWYKVADAKPDETVFRYNVRADGLYYFAVQAIDKNGVADPPEASKAAKVLKVQVETRKPATPESSDAPPPPFIPANPVAPPTPNTAPKDVPVPVVTQANSIQPPSPVAPIAPVAPPPVLAPTPTGGESATVPAPAIPQPAATATQSASSSSVTPPPLTTPIPGAVPSPAVPAPTLTPPPANEGPSGIVPLTPMKQASDVPAKPLAPPASASAESSQQPLNPDAAPQRSASELMYVKDRQVALEFEVEKKGPSGIKKIETWITQDDGLTWQRWTESFETVSPLQVALPEAEGTYGFRMVLYSGVMQSVGPPRRGDTPDLKLQVDRTPPSVAYYPPVPDPSTPNAISLRYSVADANLDANSVQLQWSRQPGSGWQTIPTTNSRPMPSSGIPGMREATWQLPPDMPDAVFLRIVAKDLAGNIGEFVTRDPVTVDLHKPTARIKAVVPSTVRR